MMTLTAGNKFNGNAVVTHAEAAKNFDRTLSMSPSTPRPSLTWAS
jgi:hypothetical protein